MKHLNLLVVDRKKRTIVVYSSDIYIGLIHI